MDISITTDDYPGETSWMLIDHTAGDTCKFGDFSNGNGCADGAGNTAGLAQGTTYNWNLCYPAGNDLEFVIFDQFGDGICCSWGSGSYSVDVCGNQVVSGGDFADCESTTINNVCHCYNGVQDGNETGVDCGGSCPACNGADICENALDISSNFGSNVCGDDAGAGNDVDDGGQTSCFDPASEIWYSFSGKESVSIDVTSWCGSSFYPNVTVYEGSCSGNLNELSCADYVANGELEVDGLDSNQTYYISIDNDGCDGQVCFDIGEASAGDCVDEAEIIDACGTTFTLDNSNIGRCGRQCGDAGGCPCSNNFLNHSNYDGDCNSECGTCPGSNRCGCDMDGSTENNAFWSFTPTETCDYEVVMDVYDCTTGDGVQYGIYEYSGGSFTNYFAHDGGTNTGTITETFTATSGLDVVIMIDGWGGDECKVDVTVNAVNCSGCTLPVELLSFEGDATERGNRLRWRTASEEHAERFVLERSRDGDEFEFLLEKDAVGTSSGVVDYSALDRDPYQGTSYYRLKQVDTDGSAERSKVVAIEREASEGFRIEGVYPNPVDQERVHLEVESGSSREIELVLFDSHGREVLRTTERVDEGRTELQLKLEELSQGFYTVRLRDQEELSRSSTAHFMVE